MALDLPEAAVAGVRSPRRLGGLYGGNTRAVLERGFIVLAKQNWAIVASGFFEPVFYLLAMGLGLGGLVGTVSGPGGHTVSYAAYIAPALLATSAMNGAIYDSTMNVFFKLRYAKLYQAMLQTSLGALDVAAGEIAMALFRGLLYACGFMVVMLVMGLVTSWWALLMVPAALLVAFGFAGIGMAATSYMKTFQHLDMVGFLLLPMFLFSSTLYPIDVFPAGVRWFIMAMPLWHGVEMMRQLSVGALSLSTAGHLLYFVAMSTAGVAIASRRLRALFLR